MRHFQQGYKSPRERKGGMNDAWADQRCPAAGRPVQIAIKLGYIVQASPQAASSLQAQAHTQAQQVNLIMI